MQEMTSISRVQVRHGLSGLVKRLAIVCCGIALLLAGCSQQAAKSTAPTKTFQMRGEVMGVDVSGHTATIKHEDIPGFMGAMTMGYPVKDPAELAKLKTGEQITATVYQQGDEFWLGNFQPAGK